MFVCLDKCVCFLFVLYVEALKNAFWWFFGFWWLCVCFLGALNEACLLLMVVLRFFVFCFCVLALSNAIR